MINVILSLYIIGEFSSVGDSNVVKQQAGLAKLTKCRFG